jgi:hypothetical protein
LHMSKILARGRACSFPAKWVVLGIPRGTSHHNEKIRIMRSKWARTGGRYMLALST